MRYIRIILGVLLLIPVLLSCNKELKVNADWRDITVIYGLLNQNDDTTFLKITKAFLGEGDAMQFAKIPDSSTYPDKLDVKVEAWQGSTLIHTYDFDTITIHSKQAGDSIFYYPDQLVYYNKTGHLSQSYTYKLRVTHRNSGVVDSAHTILVHSFLVTSPDPYIKQEEYIPGGTFNVEFPQPWGGKRFQVVIRVHYLETTESGTTEKSFDWLLFSNYQVSNPNYDSVSSVPDPIKLDFAGDVFYTVVAGNIKEDPNVISRNARMVDYIFSVASEDMNTYMEVTEPSLSIIQERPSFTNISNGVGLFSSRYVSTVDSIVIGPRTQDELKVNPLTANLKF
jgi:hypothetical protein